MTIFAEIEQPAAESGKGTSFLAAAKHEHAELFRRYVSLQRQFKDLQEYTDALQADAWKMCEDMAKRSWRNGIARGESRRRRSREA